MSASGWGRKNDIYNINPIPSTDDYIISRKVKLIPGSVPGILAFRIKYKGVYNMELFALKTENRFNQYLIFTSKKELLEWAHRATSQTDGEILANVQHLTKNGSHYNLFPEV